ncbi:ABC transporter substrate-binding protein [Streptomyces triticirhizae]|uniref:Carbohydrate ABC transporter substrate-binding protein n=1 Tax=Streptomyces triticirhizae TaxID=2483353 RepID=A0A3M2LI10_9ACTN|nr:ABC transporter substrate-binding protein [Streptomyces triticirhizae]RMI37117.1 carbohydrate ABC transporter substrate-binding protein [Streptomyces triticirhizae]
MRRRTMLAGAVSAALAPALTSCGALDPGNDDPDTLVVHNMFTAGGADSEVYDTVCDTFERENPGSRIKNLVSGGTDLVNVYETARLAGKEADVVMVNLAEKSLSWSELGATVPVTRYLDDWGLAGRVIPQALTEWTDPQGRLMGFPWSGFTWPVAFNTALLEAAGVGDIPRTVDEMLAAADAVRSAGAKGLVAIGGNDWSGQKLLMQVMQAYLQPADAERLFREAGFADDPDALRGLAHFVELRDAGVFFDGAQGLNADSMNTDFYSGRAPVASLISGTLASVPPEVAEVTELGGWPVPADSVYDRPTALRGYTSTGIWISPNGEKKIRLVERFVKHFYSEETTARFVRDAGQVTALKDTVDSPDFPLIAESVLLSEESGGEGEVAYAVLPDLFVPAAVSQPLIRATSVAFTPGNGAESIARALDTAYRS